MPWADRDRLDSPQERLVYDISTTSPIVIAGRAPSAGATKRGHATEYALKWQQCEEPKICAQSGPFQGFNPLLRRDSKAIHRILLRVKAVGICTVSSHKRSEGEQWF